MPERNQKDYFVALEDFRTARRQSALEQIVARMTGKSVDLLSYEDVRQKLRAKFREPRKLKEIPLDAIVGSVDRYKDFTRSFLPKDEIDEHRWAGVRAATTGMIGLPPIEVYQINDVYFVEDGNHRVSVARQLGATHIQAYVTKFEAKVPLTPDVQPDELIIKAEYAEFLEHTSLDEIRPESDLTMTAPGGYRTLEEHIHAHQYFMGLNQQRNVPLGEAVAHWYDNVYGPVVKAISDVGILRDFPGRTEADLYLWVSEHRAALEEILGIAVQTEDAAEDLAAQKSQIPGRVVYRLGERLVKALLPDELEGASPSKKRRYDLEPVRAERLFEDILVAINGDVSRRLALEQTLVIARHEGSRVYGLHVVPSEEELESVDVQDLKADFEQRCDEAGIEARFLVTVGEISSQICERTRWVDLAVLKVKYPPEPKPLSRLSSGLSMIFRRCPRPILAVRRVISPLSRGLVAYDGSPKGEEALYIGCYLASRWGMPLTVLTVGENGRVGEETIQQAREYLEQREIQATYLYEEGKVPEKILEAVEQQDIDLVLIGGYGRSPLQEVVLGSAVDEVLRESEIPVLICR